MLKTAIATAILGLGITGAYFVINNTNISSKISSKEENNSNISTKPFVENLNSLSSRSPYFPDLKNNRTDQYIGGIIEKIVMENPDISSMRQENGSLNIPDADLVASELLTKAQIKFSEENIIPIVSDGDLKIIENISLDNLDNYARKSDAISTKIFALPAPNNQTDLDTELPKIIMGYQNAIAELYNLPVPKLMAGIHKTKISYLSAELVLLKRMLDMKQDPVSAILASRNFLDIENKFHEELTKQMISALEYTPEKYKFLFSQQ